MIFHDPTLRRSRRFKSTISVLAIALTAAAGATAVTVLDKPPKLAAKHNGSALTPVRTDSAPPASDRYRGERDSMLEHLAMRRVGSAASREERWRNQRSEAYGFMVDWDPDSLRSFERHARQLDVLVPEWLHVYDGKLREGDRKTRQRVLSRLTGLEEGPAVTPLVNNYDAERGRWDVEGLSDMLSEERSRDRLVERLLRFVRQNDLDGICVDFEGLGEDDRGALVDFMTALHDRFHPLGLHVTQCVPAADGGAYDHRRLAASCDRLILMMYDEHSASSGPGPVASQGWFARTLAERFAAVPPDKYVIALGGYGYDWSVEGTAAAPMTFDKALSVLRKTGGRLEMDEASLNPKFAYRDQAGARHEVWLLDAVTAFNQLVAGKRHHPAGFALWRLGAEDAAVWRVLETRDRLGSDDVSRLKALNERDRVAHLGQGAVLKVTASRNGRRDVVYDGETGLITEETVAGGAAPLTVERSGFDAGPGGGGRKVALTFDDGPDPAYTPRILDILARHGVHATFFVVGDNAIRHPALLKRIAAEGHEIGHHTYSHTDLTKMSARRLELETNATQRVFESRLGLRSHLFRPPLVREVAAGDVRLLQRLSELTARGYVTVVNEADPQDWLEPPEDQIVSDTIRQVRDGRATILLHDSGGNREATVRALPGLLDALDRDGYEAVTVSGLMGVSARQVNTPIAAGERPLAFINAFTFEAFRLVGDGPSWIVAFVLVLGLLRVVLVGSLLAFRRRSASRTERGLPAAVGDHHPPRVAVLVPAFNEEKVIAGAIDSVLMSDYPRLIVLVIDDGSTDATSRVVRERFGGDPRVRLHRIPNGGKAGALNHGMRHCEAGIVVTIDADSQLAPDAVRKLVVPFSDPRVVAVAGNVKVGNRRNVLTKWQALEYICSQSLDKRAFAAVNCVTVVPGVIGAWRRRAVVEAGGFSEATLTEDADLTLALLTAGGRICYEPTAVAVTEAPETLDAFMRQRLRWVFGTLQTFWKHRRTALRPRYRGLGMLAMPHMLVYGVLFPLLSPVVDLAIVGSVAQILARAWLAPSTALAETGPLAAYAVLFAFVDLGITSWAFMLERDESRRLLPWALVQRFFYRQLMYYVAVKAIVHAVCGRVVGWQKLDRRGTLPSVEPALTPEQAV